MSLWTSLSPASARVEPGTDASFTLTLRNDGDTVEEYQLSMVGAPAAWSVVEPQSLRLFPGAQGTAQVTVSPPRSPQAAAGPTPFGVQVRPRQNADLFDVAEAAVTVGEFSDVRAELNPGTVRGRLSGRPRISVSNFGNAPLTASFTPRDDEDALRFDTGDQTLEVVPGRSEATRLRIRPQRLRLTGQEERYPFLVGVGRAGQIDDPLNRLEPRGTFVRVPLFPKWLIALLSLLLLVVLAVIGLMTFPLPNIRTVAQELQVQPVAAPTALPTPPVVATVAPTVAPPPPAPAATQPPPTQPPAQPPAEAATQAPPAQTEAPQNQNQQDDEVAGLPKDGNGDALATITSRQDGNYLTVQNGAQDDGTPVVVSGRQNPQDQQVALNQFWVLVGYDDGSMALSPGNAAGSTLTRDGDVDQVRIRTVSGGDGAIRAGRVEDNQRWTFTDSDDGTVLIVNAATGECLTNAGADQQARALRCEDRLKPLQQWTLGDS
ncbi:RICIN domain-containing protein [Kineosporia sp. J2-2]|uniref:RICIN domain-containing protein n=1 Tax=Kineosporia corallincola TaxID=2835133 RepID=A0ABS5TP45_9ACTN|nr:RICIN domain-containing protein [Kineosporia corallincola]MBT0772882.1 RICIN domain-containing protein [Kineosporia corallincola]